MSVNLSPLGGVAAQFFDNNGVILSGGKIYTYAAGTTTNQATYTTSAGNVAHTNPIILDSAGRVPSGETWLTDGVTYKFVVKDSNDVLIGTYDNIDGINGGISSANVSYLPAGTGAVETTVQAKLRETVSVVDFGAVGDGVTDDTNAFTKAQTYADFIFVPQTLNCKVDAGLDYWKFYGDGTVFEPSRQWTLNPFPQTGDMTKTYNPRTFGIYETAVGTSTTINSTDGQEITNTQVLGTDAQGLAQVYTARDHVAQYISGSKFTPDVLDSSTTYTSTSVTNGAISGLSIKPGMIVDTLHTTPCTGIVQSVSGTVITVSAWYPRTPVGGGPVTPANGTGAIINPNTKIFGQNIVVSTGGNGSTTGASELAGIELDIFTGASVTPVSGTWGFDMVSVGGYMDVGYQIRGSRNISYFSRDDGGAGLIGFYSRGDQRGVVVEDSTNNAIVVTNSGDDVFAVGALGDITSPGWNSEGITTRGIDALQTTGVNVWFDVASPFTANYGGIYTIVGFRADQPTSRGKFLLLVNEDGVTTISGTDNTGLGIQFQLSGRQLQVRTTILPATDASFQFKSFSTVF